MSATAPWTRLADGLAFPEGPAFASDGALWCVELKGGSIVRMAGGGLRRFAVGGEPNGLAIDRDGAVWFCDAGANAIRRLSPGNGTVETVVSDAALRRPNDLAFGPEGELVFTCPGNSRREPTGAVWRWTAAEGLVCVAKGLFFPNGLAFADCGQSLVIAETYRQRILSGTWDGRGWREAHVLAEVGGPVGPDGLAYDENGVLHAAIYGQRCVRRIAPSGDLLDDIGTPGANPTNCAFDPAGRLGLVITEAEDGAIWSLPGTARSAPLFPGPSSRSEALA